MNWLLDAIGDAGYALDTPGAYLRGALAGKLGERASGEELLGSYGVDGGALGGMAAEMVLDPLALAAPALGAFKGVQGINRATKGLQGLAHADDANPLLRSAAGLAGGEAGTFEPFRKVSMHRGLGGDPAKDWMVLNAGVRESVANPMPEEVARLTKYVDESGNPAVAYHGTRGHAGDRTREGGRPSGDFDQFDPAKVGGLIHFTDTPSVAARYAHGSGGNRRSTNSILADDSTGDIYTLGGSGTPDFGFHYQGSLPEGVAVDEIFTPDMANLIQRSGAERFISPDLAQRQVDDGVFRTFLENAVMRKHFLDVRNPLHLKTPEGLETLASLDASTDLGREIVRRAGKRSEYGSLQDPHFDWGDTKYEPIHRVFQNDLNPLLKGLGHDAIYFGDHGHDTLSVFDPSQVYDPLVRRRP